MKKAKNKGGGQLKMSPERYMKERVKKLPIGKCYINPDWKEEGIAHIIITRNRAGGQTVFASFLVDTFCLGVKDADYAIDFTPDEVNEALSHFRESHELIETDYNTVHNLIFGAIEFAEEGGIQPVKQFSVAGEILAEDTDDIPLMEFEYGKEGKHFLIIGKDGYERKYMKTLSDHLGDRFIYVDLGEIYDEEESEGIRDLLDEKERHPSETYSYKHPEYPAELKVKHQFIADALLSVDNYEELPKDVIKRILMLHEDEAAEDISNIALYSIGKTYRAIEEGTIGDPTEGSLLHAMILLTQLQSVKGLPGLLEINRQSEKFIEFHFGDLYPEMMPMALSASATDDLSSLEAHLYDKGIGSDNRTIASEALSITANLNPEKRDEVIEIFRRLLVSMKERLPKTDACDATFAGFVMSHLTDMQAKELLPEIKEVFDTECVDLSITGDYNETVGWIENNPTPRKYEFPTLQEQYEFVKS